MNSQRYIVGIRPMLAAVVLAYASTATGLDPIDWYTIDAGGDTSVGGSLELTGTVGQPDAGVVMTGGGFSLAGGFWAGAAPGPGATDCSNHDWDFDDDGDVDLGDFSNFALCFAGANQPPAGTCPPGIDADCDGDGDVDLSDFASFAFAFTGSM